MTGRTDFQSRVEPWLIECFGEEVARDRRMRNFRFFEETCELIQANGMTRLEAYDLVDYVFDRPIGELRQEIGGVMITLAALCVAADEDMAQAGEEELARVLDPAVIEKIRLKQKTKPTPGSSFEAYAPQDHSDYVVGHYNCGGRYIGLARAETSAP